MKSYNTFT